MHAKILIVWYISFILWGRWCLRCALGLSHELDKSLMHKILVNRNYKIWLLGECPTKHTEHSCHTLIRVSSVGHRYLVHLKESI